MTVDRAFFDALWQIGGTPLLLTMQQIALNGDAQSIAQLREAFALFEEDDAPSILKANDNTVRVTHTFNFIDHQGIGYPKVVATALRCEDSARLADHQVDSDRMALLEAAMRVFDLRANNRSGPLQSLLVECIHLVGDPRVFDKLLDAGASMAALAAHNGGDNEYFSAMHLALVCGNANAFLAMAERCGLDSPGPLRGLIPGRDEVTGQPVSSCIANMLDAEDTFREAGTSTSPVLKCLEAVERALLSRTDDVQDGVDQVTGMRCLTLTDYLRKATTGWNSEVVSRLLNGSIGRVDAGSAAPGPSWDRLDPTEHVPLLCLALQAHCWPAVEKLLPHIRHVLNPDNFVAVEPQRSTRAHNEQWEDMQIGGCGALGLMVTSIAEGVRVNADNFARTFALINDPEILATESVEDCRSRQWPAMRQLAVDYPQDRGWILSFLIDQGLDPEVVAMEGELCEPFDLTAREQWHSIVRSKKARAAAATVIDELNAVVEGEPASAALGAHHPKTGRAI